MTVERGQPRFYGTHTVGVQLQDLTVPAYGSATNAPIANTRFDTMLQYKINLTGSGTGTVNIVVYGCTADSIGPAASEGLSGVITIVKAAAEYTKKHTFYAQGQDIGFEVTGAASANLPALVACNIVVTGSSEN